jgi:hypothetical protein
MVHLIVWWNSVVGNPFLVPLAQGEYFDAV